jgi:hypothetical protein
VNALIPVFVAVLLAEVGGALSLFGWGLGSGRCNAAALAMGVLITVAVVGGWSVGSVMIAPAKGLMLGLALSLAGVAQFGRPKEVASVPALWASGITVYRSPAPFLAFGFAAWMNAPVSAGVGAMLGVGVAAGIGAGGFVVPRGVRVGSGMVLCLAGLFAALSGLRLV